MLSASSEASGHPTTVGTWRIRLKARLTCDDQAQAAPNIPQEYSSCFFLLMHLLMSRTCWERSLSRSNRHFASRAPSTMSGIGQLAQPVSRKTGDGPMRIEKQPESQRSRADSIETSGYLRMVH